MKNTQHSPPTLHFCKMHGLGNDFVVINAMQKPLDIQSLPIAQLADRHRGIGFDQLLIIEPSQEADFFCRIFNADGSEAEQCGNGLRCVARLVHEEGLHPESSLRIETRAGVFPLFIEDNDYHTIRMIIDAPHIQHNHAQLKLKDHTSLQACVLSLGNPHAIVKVESVGEKALNQLGREICIHPFFPEDTNVGFMEVINSHQIHLLTFERGVGETHACGSNACAAVVAGVVNGWLEHPVEVKFRYGSLQVEWQGGFHPINIIGPASRVFSGEIAPK